MPNISLCGIALLTVALALGACNSTGPHPLSSGTGTIAEVTKATQNVCSFVPTAATVLGILLRTNLGTVGDVAGAICKAIAPLSSGPGLEGVRPGYVGSTKVEGRFTN